QHAVGTALDEIFVSGAEGLDEIFDQLLLLSDGQRQQAFDSLSGVQHANAQTLALMGAQQFQGALLDRLGGEPATVGPVSLGLALADGTARQVAAAGEAADAVGGRANTNRGLWVRGLGGFGRLDDSDNASGADYRSGGVMLGVDGQVGEALVAGLAFGYLRTDADVSDGELELDSFQLAGYGGWRDGDLYVNGTAALGFHDVDSARGVAVGGFSGRADADYAGWTAGAAAEAGYDFAFGASSLTPFAGLAYSHLGREGFTEEGAGAANLSVDSEQEDSLLSSLGLRLSHRFVMPGGI